MGYELETELSRGLDEWIAMNRRATAPAEIEWEDELLSDIENSRAEEKALRRMVMWIDEEGLHLEEVG